MTFRFALLAIGLTACAHRAPAPAYPPPPASAHDVAAAPMEAPPETALPPPDVPPRPRPTGDRERDALNLGFWGCRMMGLRLSRSLAGRATLRATLDASGAVLEVLAEHVEGLPRPVIDCMLTRVAHIRFDRRDGDGSVLTIPVDFTRPEAPEQVFAPTSPSQNL